jgi:hypothetical protein
LLTERSAIEVSIQVLSSLEIILGYFVTLRGALSVVGQFLVTVVIVGEHWGFVILLSLLHIASISVELVRTRWHGFALGALALCGQRWMKYWLRDNYDTRTPCEVAKRLD